MLGWVLRIKDRIKKIVEKAMSVADKKSIHVPPQVLILIEESKQKCMQLVP